MKNKGFTLVELLAVIVIISIISIIVIPIVTTKIEESRKNAYYDSAHGIKRALENYYISYDLSNTGFTGYDCIFPNQCDEISFKGKIPDTGRISLDKDGNVEGYISFGEYSYHITNDEVLVFDGNLLPGTEYVFDYTGEEKVLNVLSDGLYKLEVWGAQGGSITDYYGGYGGYSTGIVYLNEKDKLYINVGGKGSSTTNGTVLGGYNGGGDIVVISSCGNNYGSGGGATHIATSSGLLSTFENKQDDLLIVAGGGGGADYRYCSSSDITRGNGSSGGGFQGSTADYYATWTKLEATGGTQTSGGTGGTTNSESGTTNGSFGKGGSYSRTKNNVGQAGGGGGYYGGGLGMFSPGGGGSGYIGNSLLSDKAMYCYNCTTSSDESTKTYSTQNYSTNAVSGYAKLDNGYAKITYLGNNVPISTQIGFSYTGGEQTFKVPASGNYKLEVWGAQGGNATGSDGLTLGGYGGYSTGVINLNETDILKVVVGGSGNSVIAFDTVTVGGNGYNGGGTVTKQDYVEKCGAGGGGGATHIAKVSGKLADIGYTEFVTNGKGIIVAGGGGGAAVCFTTTNHSGIGGAGGGANGMPGTPSTVHPTSVANGGTQTSSSSNSYAPRVQTEAGFGNGCNPIADTSFSPNQGYLNSAGGGGLYGGACGVHGGAGGGSGYIGNTSLSDKSMYCYNCTESGADSTKTISTTNASYNAVSQYAKMGNGYVRITYLGENS